MKTPKIVLAGFLGATALFAGASGSMVSLTIYNSDFALVRERFDLAVSGGRQTVDFTGMTQTLEPSSVVLRARGEGPAFRILEQSYRADPVSQESALAYFEGRTIRFQQVSSADFAERIVDGKIVRAGGGGQAPIIEVDGEFRFGLPGLPLFPAFGDDSILTPTLTWQVAADAAGTVPVELSYLTGRLNWEADYNFVSREDGRTLDLIGWVTVTNRSGRDYADARLKLLAGQVNRVRDEMQVDAMMMARAGVAESAPVTGEAFDDFHLYTLAEPTTLRDREQKQVEFIRADGITGPRTYRVSGSAGFRGGRGAVDPSVGAATQRLPVRSLVTIENSEDNGLGMAMPAGRARFYRPGSDGELEFIGEGRIGHTPRDETISLELGEAFDLVAERRQQNFTRDDRRNRITETIVVELRNQSDDAVTIEVVETLFRFAGWEIRQSSVSHERIDSRTVRFVAEVPSRGSTSVEFTVEYNW